MHDDLKEMQEQKLVVKPTEHELLEERLVGQSDALDSAEPHEPQDICQTCSRPVQKQLRKGSLTAWIFNSSSCQCDVNLRVEQSPDSKSAPESHSVLESTAGLPDLGQDYEVLEKIGQGGMGSVYKARDKALGKTFAIKILRYELAQDNDAVKRFSQEAEAASRLTHGNLGNVYKHGNAKNGAPYLVMDYIDGRSLSDVIRNEEISLDRFFDIFIQVCEGLDHAHKKGVIHRDLKPSNIIISKSPDGNDLVHLVDFGIAKVLAKPGETLTSLTQTGDMFGSPLYMSPEQCEGGTIDARSDIYSLGCVFYEAFAKQPPYNGNNPFKVMMRQVTEPIPDMGYLRIPSDLASIVYVCLQKDPQYRYQSAYDLLRDLLDVQAGASPKRYPRVKVEQRVAYRKSDLPPKRRFYNELPDLRLTKNGINKGGMLVDLLKIGGSVLLLMIFIVWNSYNQPVNNQGRAAVQREMEKAHSLEEGLGKAAHQYMENGDYVKAIPLLELMVNKDRADGENEALVRDLEVLAICYSESGDYFGTNRCYKAAIAAYHSMGESYRGGLYQLLIRFASALHKQKRHEEAAVYEKQARELQPDGMLHTTGGALMK